MKKQIFLFLAITISFSVFSQTNNKVLGIWQMKLNGKPYLAKDMGYTGSYANWQSFIVFCKNDAYMITAPNKTAITKTNLSKQLTKQQAHKLSYQIFDSIQQMPQELQEKFEEFKENKFFVEITPGPISFYYNTKTKNLQGLNNEVLLEAVKVGPSW